MPQAPWAAWPGSDGQFSARDWDLQVPHSPRGALPEVPTHSGPAAGSDQGCPQSLPHGTASPVPTCAFPAPWPCSGVEVAQQELSPGLANPRSPCALPGTSGLCCCSLALATSPWDRLCLGSSLLASHFAPGLFK